MKSLQPELLWSLFDTITTIPRPSKKEEKILEYIKLFAIQHNLQYKQDSIGNIVVYCPATEGMENHQPVILQSHVDMVCEKSGDIEFNFETDPISTYIEDGWVKTHGTTLGADNGIGVAAALAAIVDSEVVHPPIEALFTVDEECGLGGARGLDTTMLSAKRLINLDSGEEGAFFIGCAGGVNTVGIFKAEKEEINCNKSQICVVIKSLRGGHSGDDINKNRANAIVLLGRLLYGAKLIFDLDLCHIDGGNLPNAIARDIETVLAIESSQVEQFKEYLHSFKVEIESEYHRSEPDMEILTEAAPISYDSIINRNQFYGLVDCLFTLPSGVMAFSQDIEGFVESSTNVASIKMNNSNQIVVHTSQRSSVESKKGYIAQVVRQIMKKNGAQAHSSGEYPGWSPQNQSTLAKELLESYKKLYGKDASLKAVHAGLECAIFLSKCKDLEMVSLGPTMEDIHSPSERLNIASTNRFYGLLGEVLKNL